MSSFCQVQGLARDILLSTLDGIAAVEGRYPPMDAGLTAAQLSIPRVDVDLEFALDKQAQKTVLIFWKKKQSGELRRHRLRFSLVAIPEPPPAAVTAQSPALKLIEPPFLVSESERVLYIAKLRRALAAQNPRGKLDDEIKLLAQDPDRVVCLRLDPQPDPAVLIARVGGKGIKNDGLFVLNPGAEPSAVVYSRAGDGKKEVAYAPLNRLARAIRRWLLQPRTRERTERGALQSAGGLQDLELVLTYLRDNYALALRALADAEFGGAGTWPLYYDLVQVEAELSYAVAAGESADARFNFESVEGSSYSLIESAARIRVVRGGGLATIRAELLAPEFVLQGAKLQRFVRGVRRSVEHAESGPHSLLAAADPAKPGLSGERLYRRLLSDSSLARGAVCLLSYKGDKPTANFLVVWPGPHGRDFAFTCRFDDDSETVTDVRVLLTLGDEIGGVLISAEFDSLAENLSKQAYKAFHNFFHAVEIWQTRTQERPA